MNPKRLFAEAKRLPPKARAALAGELLESLDGAEPDPAVGAAWDEEIARRLDDVDSGRVTPMSATEARRRVRAAATGETRS